MRLNPEIIRFEYYPEWYNKILKIFGFDQKKDIIARDLIYSYQKDNNPSDLITHFCMEIKNRNIIYFGAGPNLIDQIEQKLEDFTENRDKYYFISADGASNALNNFALLPDIIVTDLDGLSKEQFSFFKEQGVIFLVHAHGDNIDQLKDFSLILRTYKKIIPTTQVEPLFPVINPGGFTDGDRGVYFMHHLSPISQKFYLLGYEFEKMVGQYSKNEYSSDIPADDVKLKKLKICKQLLLFLREKYKRDIIFL